MSRDSPDKNIDRFLNFVSDGQKSFSILATKLIGKNMKRGILESNQHLNREQVLKTFEALGYPLGNIVSDVTLIDPTTGNPIPGSEISSPEALNQAIQDVISKTGNKNHQLVLFRVGAESKSFVTNEGENNHYVALHFAQEGPNLRLTYIDPTGAGISPQINGMIASNPSLASCTITSSQTSLQVY